MEFSPTLGLIAFVMVNLLFNVACITYKRNIEDHVRVLRAQGGEPPVTDWEIGLREAAHQALLRDGHVAESLHEYLQKASFSGRHDSKAFGDIAILARGQLYATPAGFAFVQEPYYNDCDECYNQRRRCQSEQCGQHVFDGTRQLVALWTVKRIRHRDDNYGHRYEIEYTISPVDKALSGGFITRNGKFDYGIPGHVFVIRSNPRYTNGYEHNRFFSSPDQVKWHRNFIPRPTTGQYPTILIADKLLPPHIIHNSKDDVHYEVTSSTIDPKEIQLYRELIQSLAAKTSTTGRDVKIEAQETSPQRSTTPPTEPSYQITPTLSSQRTTLVQLPTGRIVPLTQISTSTLPQQQFQLLTPVQIAPFQTIPTPISGNHLVPTKSFGTTDTIHYPHTESDIPQQIPSTEIPIFIMKELIPPSIPSVRSEIVKDMGSTKLPKKTTIHFFAAGDDDKSPQDHNTNDRILKPIRQYLDRKHFTKPSPRKTTKQDFYDEEDFDVFSAVQPTEAMKKITEGVGHVQNQIGTARKYTTLPPSTTNEIQQLLTTNRRRTTIPEPTRPTMYGTQGTKITSVVPTSRSNIYGTQATKMTPYILSSTTGEKATTIFRKPTVFGTITTTQFPFTTLAPATTKNTYVNYDVPSTSEPRETIVTVTPAQTISVGYSTYEDSTVGTTRYTENTFNPISRTEFTKQPGSPLDKSFSRTTLVYPSTRIISTTFPPRTVSTNLEENISSRLSTTQAYTTNIETIQTTNRDYNSFPTITTDIDEKRQSTPPYSSTAIETSSGGLTSDPETTETKRQSTKPYSLTSIRSIIARPTSDTGTTTYFKPTPPTNFATTKLKPNKFNNNDFLVEHLNEDVSEHDSKDRSKIQEYTDDDIFGPRIKPKDKQFNRYRQHKSSSYKTYFTTEPTRTVAKTPKIIYSDFYQASTAPPTTSLTQFYAESNNHFLTKSIDVTTEHVPPTSQSYLTSISYEVNKRNFTPSLGDLILPTIKAKLSNLVNDERVQIFKAELINSAENITQREADKQAFDSIALQLINHARSLDVLNKKPREEVNPTQEKKSPKYKRRNLYVPKSRRNQSGKKKVEK